MSETIKIQLNQEDYDRVIKAIDTLSKNEARKVMSQAINKTAMEAKKILKSDARGRYIVKASEIEAATKLERSKMSTMKATIRYSEKAQRGIEHFKTSKASKKSGVKAEVLRSGSLKPLIKGNIKAFYANVGYTTSGGESGIHAGVFQRKGRERLPIKHLYSITIPKMIENDNVYGKEESAIQEKLAQSMENVISQALGG